MPRADRLLTLMDALRRRRGPVTAAVLGEELGVSVRTVYRDLEALAAMGARVEGEAGVGFVLRGGLFLPPLLFDEAELEALVLGARWVQRQPDADLAAAAVRALSKIATARDDLRQRIDDTGLVALPNWGRSRPPPADLQRLREAIRREEKLLLAYTDAGGQRTSRVIWPLALAFYEGAQAVVAWCELRQDYRYFRVERMGEITLLGEPLPRRRAALLSAWRAQAFGEEPNAGRGS